MRKKLFILLYIGILCSCNESDSVAPNDSDKQPATVRLLLTGTQSDARGSLTIPSQSADNSVNSFLVFIFDSATKLLDVMKTASAAEISAKQILLTTPSGAKDIYVVVNPQAASLAALGTVTSLSGLRSVVSDLKAETEGNFIMLGKRLNYTLTPTGTNNVTVSVSRLVSRIVLTNIIPQFTHGLATKSLVIDSIYLTRATGTKSYADSAIVVTPAVFYNRNQAGFAFPIYDRFSPAVTINNTTPFATVKPNGVHYYAYANSANSFATATKLVITGLLNGVRTYYPIAVNVAGNGFTPTGSPGIVANTQYNISVSLSGFGSSSPNEPVEHVGCSITVTPQEWATILNQNVNYN